MSDFKSVASHMASALKAAPMSFEPWRHVVARDIFPADFLKAIEAAYCYSDSLFQEQVHTGDKDLFTAPYHERSEFRVSADAEIRQQQGAVWDVLWQALNSKTFYLALKHSLAEDLLERYDDYLGHPQFFELLQPALIVTRHSPGYYLGPHTDRSEKAVTCIFNIAADDDLHDIGTALYTPLQKGMKSNGRLHFDFDKFKLEKVTPYARNSALFFSRTDVTFHGVEQLTAENLKGSERRNIQFNLWDLGHRPK